MHDAILHPSRWSLQQAANGVWHFVLQSGVFVPLFFVGLMLWRAPYLDRQDFDYDEGINLMKAMLFGRGHALYSDVWSDQPPLLTALLAWSFNLFGESLPWARLLIIVLAALLLWSFYLSVHHSVSALAATVAVILLVTSEFYIRLSGAVMVGLPALALGTISVSFLIAGKPRVWKLVASGVLMALALQTKLLAGLLAPAMLLHLWYCPPWYTPTLALRPRLGRVVIWSASVAVAFLAIGLFFQSLRLDLLVGTHLGTQTQVAFALEDSPRFFGHFRDEHIVYLLVAPFGVIWAIWRRNRAIILPLAWFLTAALALTFHRPLWYHHVLLLTIPLCWLCAFSVELWLAALRTPRSQREPARMAERVLVGMLGLACAAAFILLPRAYGDRLNEQMNIYRPLFVWSIQDQLRSDAEQEPDWVFTDRPFYAFQAGVLVTPPIASLSRKRLESGIITEEMMLDALQSYEPRYVVLERFTDSYSARVMEEIDDHYELVLENEPARYYRRN